MAVCSEIEPEAIQLFKSLQRQRVELVSLGHDPALLRDTPRVVAQFPQVAVLLESGLILWQK